MIVFPSQTRNQLQIYNLYSLLNHDLYAEPRERGWKPCI